MEQKYHASIKKRLNVILKIIWRNSSVMYYDYIAKKDKLSMVYNTYRRSILHKTRKREYKRQNLFLYFWFLYKLYVIYCNRNKTIDKIVLLSNILKIKWSQNIYLYPFVRLFHCKPFILYISYFTLHIQTMSFAVFCR